jgi:hypothetical protein
VGAKLLNFNSLICAQENRAVYSVRGRPLRFLTARGRYTHVEYGSGCDCDIKVT